MPRRVAPRALGEREVRRLLRTVEREANCRDRVVALLPYYAGLRDSEVVGLDVDDVRLAARKGEIRVLGKGGKIRILPVHAELRSALQVWLQERPAWVRCDQVRALVVPTRGGRLSDRSVRSVIGHYGEQAGLEDDPARPFGPHVLRHTFSTQLVRAGKHQSYIEGLGGPDEGAVLGPSRRRRRLGSSAPRVT